MYVRYTKLDSLGVESWINGGLGVDALLERETRSHSDLDIAMQEKDALKLREVLVRQGYHDVQEPDASRWDFVLCDNAGHEVDVHTFIWDAKGHVVEGIKYPDGSLTGVGKIGDHPVRCISPEHMVKFQSGYKLRNSDIQDVAALCERFNIEYPEEYTHLRRTG